MLPEFNTGALLSSLLKRGERLEGYSHFRGYKVGSWSSPGRFFSLAALFVISLAKAIFSAAGYFFEEGEPPEWYVWLSSLPMDGLVSEATDVVLPSLFVASLGYVAFCWHKHARVTRALEDLNYHCSTLLNREYGVSADRACEVFCAWAAKVLGYEIPFSGVGCAVRYADDGGCEYRTVARAGGLSGQRQESTEPLGGGSSLLKMLNDCRNEKVVAFVCDDTKSARDAGALDRDENGTDRELSKEDRSLIVSRLFARDGAGTQIIGIFYVTARRRGAFTADRIDLYLYLRQYLNFMLLTILDRAEIVAMSSSEKGESEDECQQRGDKKAAEKEAGQEHPYGPRLDGDQGGRGCRASCGLQC